MNKVDTNLQLLLKDKQVRNLALAALLVLLIGFSLSLAGFVELQQLGNERLYLQAQQHTAARIKQIQTNIDLSLDSLTEIAGLYEASGDVSRQQLIGFISSDTKYHSGTTALGWAPKTAGIDVDQLEQDVRETDPNFYAYEVTGHGLPVPVSRTKDSYPIKFMISPDKKNMKAGLNIASIPSRARVMKKAERTQLTAITQRISVYSGSQQFYGFQAFHPVFSKNKVGQSQLAGYVLGRYDIRPFIEDVFINDNHQLDMVLYDANSSSQQFLYSSTQKITTVNDLEKLQQPHWTYTLKVADQQWIALVLPNMKNLTEGTLWLPYIGLIVGGLMTALLILYLFVSLIKTRQVVQLATDLAGTTTQLDIQTKLKQEADKANQAKSALLRAASHDLRQPLHTIGLLTTLLKDSSSEQERKQITSKVLTAVDGMNTMFSSLLDISLLESQQLSVNKSHFYLQDLIDKLGSDFSLLAGEKGLDFSVVETSACVMTDPILLERMLRNLLSNALRYTPQGKILLGCRRLKAQIRICVLDSGIGLTQQSQENVFDSFYRDEQAKQLSDQGLGLGLAIVQEAANVLELDIGLKSEHGKGTLFYIDVPYGDSNYIGEDIIEQTQVDVQALAKKVIWLIEDDETIRASLEKILRARQCQVQTFASGDHVNTMLRGQVKQPDIIIADYQLVNETGFDVSKQIQQYFQYAIPVIIITGTTEQSVRNRIEQANFYLMMKPVSTDDLMQLMHQL